ncbi:uncharacterized protein LOC111087517 [Limulus polyphemus]|uniref:Uncharacterized protein LOC111087517 n=1 Tax=Limulus polyphemus TaxID=6850 RepID=A0ABM1T2J7_LIMPO|nr:uncharacterized protein LOC111087517 [Limulus polyphemus]XP_022250104.1 uncharacterized protein LOC111087517 [Limulus polyphemus]XP_022250105.1 uncharacterized protein LOC111087517 [Limulus polyphemus]
MVAVTRNKCRRSLRRTDNLITTVKNSSMVFKTPKSRAFKKKSKQKRPKENTVSNSRSDSLLSDFHQEGSSALCLTSCNNENRSQSSSVNKENESKWEKKRLRITCGSKEKKQTSSHSAIDSGILLSSLNSTNQNSDLKPNKTKHRTKCKTRTTLSISHDDSERLCTTIQCYTSTPNPAVPKNGTSSPVRPLGSTEEPFLFSTEDKESNLLSTTEDYGLVSLFETPPDLSPVASQNYTSIKFPSNSNIEQIDTSLSPVVHFGESKKPRKSYSHSSLKAIKKCLVLDSETHYHKENKDSHKKSSGKRKNQKTQNDEYENWASQVNQDLMDAENFELVCE